MEASPDVPVLALVQLIVTGALTISWALLRWSLKRHIDQYDEWRICVGRELKELQNHRAQTEALRGPDGEQMTMLLNRLTSIESTLQLILREQGQFVRHNECASIHAARYADRRE